MTLQSLHLLRFHFIKPSSKKSILNVGFTIWSEDGERICHAFLSERWQQAVKIEIWRQIRLGEKGRQKEGRPEMAAALSLSHVNTPFIQFSFPSFCAVPWHRQGLYSKFTLKVEWTPPSTKPLREKLTLLFHLAFSKELESRDSCNQINKASTSP